MFKHEVTFNQAKSNVIQHFAFVGVIEKMEMSMELMNQVVGEPLGSVPHSNKTRYKPLDQSERKEIEERMQQTDAIDFKFYAWCYDRLKESPFKCPDLLR